MFQPLIPLICDAFAHTFENELHIATVHVHYGNNHLETALIEANTEGKSEESHAALNSEEPFPVHFAKDSCAIIFTVTDIPVKHAVANLSLLSFVFIAKQFPPPKFC